MESAPSSNVCGGDLPC